MTVNKEATLMITLRNEHGDLINNKTQKIMVTVLFNKTMEYIFVNTIKEVDGGRYEASFTASSCGYYKISDGHHIPGSPYR